MRRVIPRWLAFAMVVAVGLAWSGEWHRANTAAIGGPFELVDHTGRTVTEADYADSYLLVYFGYAYCPDVCPTELLVVGQAMDELGDLGAKVQPLFITIDPERDTPEALAEYVPEFHPRMVGLTGTPEQIKAAAKTYRVYFRAGEPDEDGAYLMEHTSYTYLIDPTGEYVTHFAYGQGPEKMAEIISKHLNNPTTE
jgi:protein SCO1/2